MTFSQRAENALIDYLHVYIQTMNFDLAKYIGLVAYKPRAVKGKRICKENKPHLLLLSQKVKESFNMNIKVIN